MFPARRVWWPPMPGQHGEKLKGVRVVAFAAPLFFLNADDFRRDMIAIIERDKPSLIVFEASGVAEIDFTAAHALLEIIDRCHDANIKFAIARLHRCARSTHCAASASRRSWGRKASITASTKRLRR